MEALSSCHISPKPQPKSPSHLLHPFHPLKPLFPNPTDTNDSFKLKASPALIFPLTPSKHKPKKFHEKNVSPNFIPIHKKNPHAIYRDIQKFARENKLDQALAILDYLDHRGVPTNVTTFSSLISACTRLKSIDAAKQVHAHIRINNLTRNEFLQTKLVNMYASCGSLDDAKQVFETMSVTSVYPWNALLRGNVVLGGRNHREVLGSFSEMRASGVALNVYTFSSLIKSLAGNRAFRQGLKTHGLLIKNGFFASYIVRTSLIDMYFKCGKIKLACRVFEEIEEKDVVVWGAMIAGFAHNRLQREALEYARWMVNEGVEVNSVILTSVLPVIGEMNARRIGQEVHAYIIKTKGYVKETFIQSGLVDMYCKCGDMVSGRKVFYGSVGRTLVSWTALLSGYVANGRLEQALRSIIWMQQEGFKPDVVTVSTVLPVCGRLKALRNGKEIHAYAVKNGFLPGVSVSTSLMMMYSKCGVLDYSVKLFDKMERKNVIAWTAMIQCYMELKCLDKAIRVFRLMQLSEHRPDSVTIARMLNVCGELKVKMLGKEIHGQALRRDLESVPFVSAEIVKMYGNLGESDLAKLAFDAVSVKGSMMWTAVIEAYGCNGRYEESIRLFKKMVSDGFSPNQFTFKVVLEVCREGGFADDALSFFTLMTKKYKIKASEEHYSSIIDLLACLGRTEEAEKFIRLRSSLAN
ncbi:pentatricopeptide repeat-containing protein at1g71460 chloroplastic [Phtheirospermum japonicum]|uniref:Pentatricopeptide repeat-containing protein at1g71460 chloroplastic n=1 Tax=Phtheirospermum japonicum TaxID=374723 RepID=A0A830D260_9LAMI|nr:pentatricopeptide repeat-containing protein at1g71460 chloroplastic [Phtheirospermum japonicum]